MKLIMEGWKQFLTEEFHALKSSTEIAVVEFKGERKTVTYRDIIWFAKMVHAETRGTASKESTEYMCWALLNRLSVSPKFWKMAKKTWRRYIQTYSQPISAAWAGKFCDKDHPEYRGPKRCTSHIVHSRREFIKMPTSKINKKILKDVLAIFRGQSINPDNTIVGWFGRKSPGARSVRKGKQNRQFATAVEGNEFYRRPDKEIYPVTIIPHKEIISPAKD